MVELTIVKQAQIGQFGALRDAYRYLQCTALTEKTALNAFPSGISVVRPKVLDATVR